MAKTLIGNIKGPPGVTPHIGKNGNWYLGATDTNVAATAGAKAAETAAAAAASSAAAAETARNNAEKSATNAAQFAQAATNMANSAADATFNARNAQTAAENAKTAAASSATTAANAANEAKGYRDEVAEMLENAEVDPANAVLYSAQNLTEAQKTQARENIGAASAETVTEHGEKLEVTNLAYATCETAADTAEKVVTVNGNDYWELAVGSVIMAYFTTTNTASNVTLNVNGTGAYPIWYNNAEYTSTGNAYTGYAKRVIKYMFNGTHWVWIGSSYDANSTYSNVALGHGYATCTTAAATAAKVGTLSSYALTKGGIVAVKFTYAVPAGATLNINSKGAKKMFYRGAAITADVIKAGDIATFMYDGTQYQLLSVDRWQEDIAALTAAAETLENEKVVLYSEAQTLTEEQKAQARANIGAIGDTDMGESETLQVVYTTSYPNTTTFAYTETTTENYSYCLAKPSEIKGGLLTVDYDPAEIPEGAASSFQLNILLFDEDGNPYKHTGSSTTWSGENVNPTYYDPGAGQSYGAVKSPFTVKIPNGCSVMVTVRCVNSGSATINRAFNKWAHDGGVTFTVSTGGSAFLKQNVGTEYAGQYLVVDEKGNIVPSAEGGGGTTALTASINPNIKSVNHRGFGTAPENTLAAFRLSKKMGFEIAECDVRMTSDGHYVLLHDTTVDRTSEGTGEITSLTFDYVRGLDFGSYKSAEYAGEQIPTFDECMKLCRDIGLQMYIDMKISSATQAIVNDLVSTVKKYRMQDKVTWISHKADLTLVRNADPSARLALIAEDVTESAITNATGLKHDTNEVIIDAGYSYITDDMVVLCQDADIPLEIYGLNTAAAIIASNSYISGFTTDTVIAGVELYKAAMDL